MRERPIIFSGPMVRAILDGRKTQTRRIVRAQPLPELNGHCRGVQGGVAHWRRDLGGDVAILHSERSPYGQPGDRLWVRETWAAADCMYQTHDREEPGVIAYRADKSARFQNPAYYRPGPVGKIDLASWNFSLLKWRPSIHMPRWASRITLESTGVRVERLQDICIGDAIAEGLQPIRDPREEFALLWDSINGRAPWARDPWVWVIEFRRMP